MRKVSEALASHSAEFITMPSLQESATIKEKFFAMSRFPNVIACIDCTHIKIKSPNKDEQLLYCNRKGWYSLNVQVCIHIFIYLNCKIILLPIVSVRVVPVKVNVQNEI